MPQVHRLAAWSGLRAGELMGLRVRNVDPLRRSVRVAETVRWAKGPTWHADTPKSARSRRTVPEIPPTLIAELQTLIAARGLGPDDYLFGEDGEPLNWEHFYVGTSDRPPGRWASRTCAAMSSGTPTPASCANTWTCSS